MYSRIVLMLDITFNSDVARVPCAVVSPRSSGDDIILICENMFVLVAVVYSNATRLPVASQSSLM